MVWLNFATPVMMVIAVWVAYRIGLRSRQRQQQQRTEGDLSHAQQVVYELDTISQQVRRSLVDHHASIVKFKERIDALRDQQDSQAWLDLAREADEILQPTAQLASQIAHAYDDIRQHTSQLNTPDQPRTDPLTGLSSRRAMEDIMKMLFAMQSRYRTRFSIAMIDIDAFREVNARHGYAGGEEVLRDFAAMLDNTVRETDIVVRFGGEEFVVVLPETDLFGVGVFGGRLVGKIREDFEITASVGVAEATDGDKIQSLLSRADSALYSAKSGGGDCVFQHTGRLIELVGSRLAPQCELQESS